jgi:hypothetical protein
MGGRGIEGTGAGRLVSGAVLVVVIFTGGRSLRGAGRGGSGGGVGAVLKGGTILGGVDEVTEGATFAMGGGVVLAASTLVAGAGGGVGAIGSTTALGFSASGFLGILLRTNSSKFFPT